jgi:hypothetical protein
MNRSVLEVFGSLPFRIRGACMAPAFADGSVVTVRARRIYLPGDVLVFRTLAGDLTAHRMLGWRRAEIVTKGDHCEIHDPPVAKHAILGAVDVPVKMRERMKALMHYGRIVLRRLAR